MKNKSTLKDWALTRLGDISTLITKGTTPTTIGYDFQTSGINFVKIESISENGQFLKDLFKHISTDCNEALQRSQLQKNDILFSIAGALGRAAIVTDDILPANINQALSLIRIPPDVVNYRYVLLALQSAEILKQLDKQKRGNAQLNLSLEDIKNLVIPIPPLAEQERIVNIIEAKVKSIEKTKYLLIEQLSYLDALPSSILRQAFNGEL